MFARDHRGTPFKDDDQYSELGKNRADTIQWDDHHMPGWATYWDPERGGGENGTRGHFTLGNKVKGRRQRLNFLRRRYFSDDFVDPFAPGDDASEPDDNRSGNGDGHGNGYGDGDGGGDDPPNPRGEDLSSPEPADDQDNEPLNPLQRHILSRFRDKYEPKARTVVAQGGHQSRSEGQAALAEPERRKKYSLSEYTSKNARTPSEKDPEEDPMRLYFNKAVKRRARQATRIENAAFRGSTAPPITLGQRLAADELRISLSALYSQTERQLSLRDIGRLEFEDLDNPIIRSPADQKPLARVESEDLDRPRKRISPFELDSPVLHNSKRRTNIALSVGNAPAPADWATRRARERAELYQRRMSVIALDDEDDDW